MSMHLSQNGFDFIKSHEGFKTKPYKAQPQETYWTVGIGHYGADVNPNKIYTEAECMALFKKDTEYFDRVVNAVWRAPMTQNMYDALFSAAYSCGNLNGLKDVLAGDGWKNPQKVAEYWYKWKTTCKGKRVPFLEKIRKKEVELFYAEEGTRVVMDGTNPSNIGPSYNSYGSPSYASSSPSQTPEANNYETYSSSLGGMTLNTDKFASNVIDKMDSEEVKHTRIYKATEPTIIVDELSMAMAERDIDTSTNQENPTA